MVKTFLYMGEFSARAHQARRLQVMTESRELMDILPGIGPPPTVRPLFQKPCKHLDAAESLELLAKCCDCCQCQAGHPDDSTKEDCDANADIPATSKP